MEDITLQALLEAGCHFGHKSERWHPRAAAFIYTEKDGIHIIDLAKTKVGLETAAAFVSDLAASGREVLFVATKRQAKGVVKQEVEAVGAPYLIERWIGGFLTNWDQVHKNIQKINRMNEEAQTGAWKKFPKHEQVKLARYLARLKVFYGGVLTLNTPPAAVFIVDVKKEQAAVREAMRMEMPIVAMVDTNSSPQGIQYVIPANDDAVGSIQLISHVVASAYREGKDKRAKELAAQQAAQAAPPAPAKPVAGPVKAETKPVEKVELKKAAVAKSGVPAEKKKSVRPKKKT